MAKTPSLHSAYRKKHVDNEIHYIRIRAKDIFDSSSFWDITVIILGETHLLAMHRFTGKANDYFGMMHYDMIDSIEWRSAKNKFLRNIDSGKMIPFKESPF